MTQKKLRSNMNLILERTDPHLLDSLYENTNILIFKLENKIFK